MLIGIYGQKEGAGNTALRKLFRMGFIERCTGMIGVGNSKGRAEIQLVGQEAPAQEIAREAEGAQGRGTRG